MLITDNLIRANHLLLILKEMEIKHYDLTSDINDAMSMHKFGGYDLIFIGKSSFEQNPTFQQSVFIKQTPLIIIGNNKSNKEIFELSFESDNEKPLVAEISIPFVKYEVKTVLKNLYQAKIKQINKIN